MLFQSINRRAELAPSPLGMMLHALSTGEVVKGNLWCSVVRQPSLICELQANSRQKWKLWNNKAIWKRNLGNSIQNTSGWDFWTQAYAELIIKVSSEEYVLFRNIKKSQCHSSPNGHRHFYKRYLDQDYLNRIIYGPLVYWEIFFKWKFLINLQLR